MRIVPDVGVRIPPRHDSKRGLAAAGRTEQHDEFAGLRLERQPVERADGVAVVNELDDEIADGEWSDGHAAPENACDGSDLSTLRMPIAPAASAITTANSGSCQNALDGTVTGSGNCGARNTWMIAASATAPSAISTACRARLPSSEPFDAPTALNTAKSRWRSSADR